MVKGIRNLQFENCVILTVLFGNKCTLRCRIWGNIVCAEHIRHMENIINCHRILIGTAEIRL